MDRDAYIQMDRIEQKLDYIINLLQEPIDEEEDEDDETPEGQLPAEDDEEKEMQRKGVLVKKSVKNKESQLKE